MQDLEVGSYLSLEFIDDCRLLGCLGPTFETPPSLVLIDTGKSVGGLPVETLFHLPSFCGNFVNPPLLLEPGAHKPSLEESSGPFYRDPTQRIVALHLLHSFGYPILRIGALLELHESREGSKIEWDEWKSHVVIASFNTDGFVLRYAWVSGCRLFSIDLPGGTGDQVAQMEVFDFSTRGCAEYLNTDLVNYELGGLRCLSSTGAKAQLPRRVGDLAAVHNNHDSIILSYVSVAASCCLGIWTNVGCYLVPC